MRRGARPIKRQDRVNVMKNDGLNSQNVVSLMGMLDEMRFPAITEMERYWESLRGTRAVPLRSEVDPRKIENCLEYAFILERIAPGLARFRLAGTHLNELIGMEVRGMPLTSIFLPDSRSHLSETLEEVFAGPSTLQLNIAADRGVGRPPLDGKMLLLPLKSDFGDISRALGCIVTQGPIGRAPRRFKVAETRVSSIIKTTVSATPAAPTIPAAAPEAPRAQSFAERPAEFKGKKPDGTATRPQLYVVKSDE
jgi:hypothetical protein